MIQKWQRKLGLMDWHIETQKICDDQVIYPKDCEREFVGIEIDKPYGIIYHSRELREDDVIHELLHIAHPDWSEDEVEKETERLYG